MKGWVIPTMWGQMFQQTNLTPQQTAATIRYLPMTKPPTPAEFKEIAALIKKRMIQCRV